MKGMQINTPCIIYASGKKPEYIAEARRRGAFGNTNEPEGLFALVVQAIKGRTVPRGMICQIHLDGVVAFTHLWWFATGPADDPLADDLSALHTNRLRVLRAATLIVPGHGAPFVPDETTPR
jgi:hypothetical protein